MLLADVAATSAAVAATPSRRTKIDLVADCLRHANVHELPVVVAWLSGSPRQRRTGVGWAGIRELPPEAPSATLGVAAVDAALQRSADVAGPGAAGRRRDEIGALLAAATRAEQTFLRDLLAGGLRQGAQAALVLEAVASVAGLRADDVRRAVTFGGDLGAVAAALRLDGAPALDRFRLRIGVPVSPMLAQSAADVTAALERIGDASVEVKLDGVRVQIHRDGDDVAVFTRTLEEIGDRLPDVVAAARSLAPRRLILDGEAIALAPDGRPLPFQVTASRTARRDPHAAESIPLSTKLFDVLHCDGEDLVDSPGAQRHEVLAATAGALLVPRLVPDGDDPTARAGQAETFARQALARGHEGVIVKSLAAPYAMGRRGSAWVKVKPRLTADLVVLAVERGHGRRSGWLSNLHLGARDPHGDYGPAGGFVMLGKTFKGLTDAMLAWQTERLRDLAVSDDGYTVTVRPELVVEVAFDGVQTSPRYPAGMALRFARVLAHRVDRSAGDCDTVAGIAAHHVPVAP